MPVWKNLFLFFLIFQRLSLQASVTDVPNHDLARIKNRKRQHRTRNRNKTESKTDDQDKAKANKFKTVQVDAEVTAKLERVALADGDQITTIADGGPRATSAAIEGPDSSDIASNAADGKESKEKKTEKKKTGVCRFHTGTVIAKVSVSVS